MNCLICQMPFNTEDAKMIYRDKDIPICDSCGLDSMEIYVN